MPDSGIISSMSPPPSHHQNPPFYSPPAPPSHGGGGGGGGGMMINNSNEEGNYHHHHSQQHHHHNHFGYNGDNNGNMNNGNGGNSYNRGGNGGGGGQGGRTVSFSSNNSNNNGNNNPNDPNNNSGMMIMMEEDGGDYSFQQQREQQQQQHLHQRDLFEEIRNGGGHWSQLLRQVVLTPPQTPSSVLDDYSQNSSGQGGSGGNGGPKDDPMMGDGGVDIAGGGNGGDNSAPNGDLERGGEDVGGDNGGNSNNNSVSGNNNSNGNNNNDNNHMVPLQIVGGSENGQFVYVGITTQDINRWITVGYLQPGDILLEIQGQQVAGYTQSDVISLLHHCLRGNSATLTVAPRGSLGPELRSYLNTRFQKGSVDHALQGVVRDNLYLRTVPVTTRSPRPGEINGVDYTFLSVEEFMELERDGSLLESGVYAGNHYGTPKPWARLTRGVAPGAGGDQMMDNFGGGGGGMEGLMHHNSMMMMLEGGGQGGGQSSGGGKGPLLPGMHPSSEGKRRRNRSNVEALGAGAGDEDNNGGSGGGGGNVGPPSSPPRGGHGQGQDGGGVELGPLPANWEMAYTDNGEVYFIDHNTGTSHWLDPRLSRVQKMSLEDCAEDELPFGWERIEDPHYGVYYIDHVNRRTQFENPVIQAKQAQGGGGGGSPSKTDGGNDRNGGGSNGMSTDSEADSTSKFLPPHHHHHQQEPPPHQPPPQPPQHHHHHLHQYLGPPPNKRPTSLSKPVPPVPNPKPQNPNRLSISQQQRTKTPVNDMEGGGHLQDNGGMLPAFPSSSSAGSSGGGLRVKPVLHHDQHGRPSYRFFTRDPSQLLGERIVTTLIKSNRGLGFTIVGGDDDDGLDEFLQIKSVVTDGPAWNDGKLRTGDVLVKVNGTCVLGYTHQEMVSIFQSISPGQDVQLEVCRGYPLPFDPADPNTEIVTTVAVAPLDGNSGQQGHVSQQKKHVDWARPGTPDSLTHSAHSLPELSNNDRLVDFGGIGGGKVGGGHRPASVDLLLDSPKGGGSVGGAQLRYPGNGGGGIFLGGDHYQQQQQAVLIVNIVKGNQGFGFTIADSLTGQKVKKVLDASHCGELEEGDRLIALDGLDLRGLSHTQVVQILKDFPVGREASLTIQRTPPNSPYNGNGGGVGGAARFFGGGGGGYMDTPRILPPPTRPPGISPRSKTPTAELGRGRPRMRDNLPERPKTPQGMLGDGGGRDYNGLFNGDLGGPNIFGHHQFLAERLGQGSNGGNGNVNNGGGDGHQNPPSNLLGGNNSDLNGPLEVRDWVEMLIELQRRQEGFGFRIVGGTEEGSQVSVGHIVPGGAAALDGRLNTGDQLIAVEGCSVIGASHRSVVQLMARSATQGKVRLTVRRPIYGGGGGVGIGGGPTSDTTTTTMVVTPIHSPGGNGGGGGGSVAGGSISSAQLNSQPLHVTLRRQPSEGFGFVIISSASKSGATIGKIVEGSPADRCGELHVGDRILAVNSMDISQLHHTQVVQLIKESGFVLTLSVLPVMMNTTPTSPTGGPPSHMHSSSTLPMISPGGMGGGGGGAPSNLQLQQQQQQQLQALHQSLTGGGGVGGMMVTDGLENLSLKDGGSQAGDMGTAFISPEGHTIHFGSNHSAASSYPEHEQVFSVHLSRGNRGFGFSIRGGKEFQNMPLFVLRLAEDGPAAMDGRMQVGDQILQINGINTHGMTHAQAIHLIKTGGASVHLLLRRGSVPFPFLNQMPNLTSGGFGGSSNGQEMEEQSMSNASNNNSVEQQFITQSQAAQAMYRDQHHHAGF